MKVKIVLVCIVVILCASIARADDPRVLRVRITSDNKYVAYVCARFEVEGKAYTYKAVTSFLSDIVDYGKKSVDAIALPNTTSNHKFIS